MTEEKKYDVFLSYSSQDRSWVSQFAEALRRAGLTAWFDIAEILPGERWQEQIQKALRESTTLIVILSPNSIKSPWTFFELGAAVADEKRIIPVLTQDMDIRDVPFLLTRFQFLRESSPEEAGSRVAEVIVRTEQTQQGDSVDNG
jgi:hypothetical protein